MGVRVSGPLCRDPHVLLVADAELDLDLEIMLDLKSFRGSVLYNGINVTCLSIKPNSK